MKRIFLILFSLFLVGCSMLSKVSENKHPSDQSYKPVDLTDDSNEIEPINMGFYEPRGKKYELNGKGFRVHQEGNYLTVASLNNTMRENELTVEASGIIDEIFTADLNANGNPEIYIIERTSEGKAEIIAFSTTASQEIVPIQLVGHYDIDKGYEGGDEFEVAGNILKRVFPIYEGGFHTGMRRVIHYDLRKGTVGGLLYPVGLTNI